MTSSRSNQPSTLTPTLSRGEREQNGDWADAIELWLSTRRSAQTRRAYARALGDLLSTSGALPWELTRTDVLRWVLELEKRGNSPATIAQYISGASSFYHFAMDEYVVRDADGKQRPLHNMNPAAGKSLRPKVEMYGKAEWLSAEEAKALLDAIPRNTHQGLRDYALFLGYILLARRNSEWRSARWGDFKDLGGKIQLRWSGKGKRDQRLEVPPMVWSAVLEYLRAMGRMGKIQEDEFVFTAIGVGGRRLPNGNLMLTSHALSAHEVGRLLKRYLRLAGIEAKHIKTHSLRHTGAMLLKLTGASDQEVMEYLGHCNLAITQVYLHTMTARQEPHWMRVSELLGFKNS